MTDFIDKDAAFVLHYGSLSAATLLNLYAELSELSEYAKQKLRVLENVCMLCPANTALRRGRLLMRPLSIL